MHYTYNARAALYQFLWSLSRGQGSSILLPAFHCVALVEPVIRAGYRPVFYRIREDLSIDEEDLRRQLCSDVAAVIVIHYFGFTAGIDWILKLRRQYQFCVVEDCAHSFLKNESGHLAGENGDAAIFSFYKLVPSYAGGGLRINAQGLECMGSHIRLGTKKSVVMLKHLVEQIIDNSADGLLRRTFQYIEQQRVARKRRNISEGTTNASPIPDWYSFSEDLAFVKMPWLSRTILRATDIRTLVATRRRNFEILRLHLKESSRLKKLFATLPPNICPWAYPVLVDDRSRFDHVLRRSGVPVFTFGELLHPSLCTADINVRSTAARLSESLMMIPLHQNLDGTTMMSMCEKINNLFAAVD
jgi:dTDP-4-amino-4,6-dideoxygalactose transaminase